jgi:hypothetical protein
MWKLLQGLWWTYSDTIWCIIEGIWYNMTQVKKLIILYNFSIHWDLYNYSIFEMGFLSFLSQYSSITSILCISICLHKFLGRLHWQIDWDFSYTLSIKGVIFNFIVSLDVKCCGHNAKSHRTKGNLIYFLSTIHITQIPIYTYKHLTS